MLDADTPLPKSRFASPFSLPDVFHAFHLAMLLVFRRYYSFDDYGHFHFQRLMPPFSSPMLDATLLRSLAADAIFYAFFFAVMIFATLRFSSPLLASPAPAC